MAAPVKAYRMPADTDGAVPRPPAKKFFTNSSHRNRVLPDCHNLTEAKTLTLKTKSAPCPQPGVLTRMTAMLDGEALKPKLQANGLFNRGHIFPAQASDALLQTEFAYGAELIRHRFSLFTV
jgi:hypothetical protein